MTKKIVSLLIAASLMVFMLVPASLAKPKDNMWQSGSGVEFQYGAREMQQEKIQEKNMNEKADVSEQDDSVANEVYESPSQGRHLGIPTALTHVKNPQAKAVLQAILDGRSVADAVYRYNNEIGDNVDPDELETVTDEVYDHLCSSEPDSNVRALTYRYMAQMQMKAGKTPDALRFMNLSARDDYRNADTYKELDSIYASAKDLKVKVYIDGKNPVFDVPPRIADGRTLVPVRFIAESLNASVAYDENTGTVTIQGPANIKMKINSKIAYVNGQQVELDVPATTESGRTMVPLRFISEGLKCKVDFYSQSNLVSITN